MSHWFTGVASALVLAGSTFAATEPAQARVSIGIGIGGPGYYGSGYGQRYNPYCDRYSRWFDPYRCNARYYNDDYYDDGYYDGPLFIDGFWFDGRYRHRHNHRHHEFFFRDQWQIGRASCRERV